ncbi:hypothetical protein HYDPIDRAFT_103344, partial [Hydnomerulius pinastri MD-312]
LKVIAAVFHGIALSCTVLRLLYRWYSRRFWWEDVWATIALIWDVFCVLNARARAYFVSDPPTPEDIVWNWVSSLSFTLVLWAARLSILLALIRVSNPTGTLRRTVLSFAGSFAVMCVTLTTQKIYVCAKHECMMSTSVAVAQLITDVISDIVLVTAPIRLLREVRMSKNRRILLLSAFSASLLISAVSIPHSVLLFYSMTNITLLLAELKAAMSLFVCNILVLVTFAYRVCKRSSKGEALDLDQSFCDNGPFCLTTIDLNQLTAGTLSGMDTNRGSVHSRTDDAPSLTISPAVSSSTPHVGHAEMTGPSALSSGAVEKENHSCQKHASDGIASDSTAC